MRTTLTLDDQLASELKQLATERGAPFKQLVNDLLRAGLQAQEHPKPETYRLRPASLGIPSPGIDLAKALQLADSLEDENLVGKLERQA